MEQFFEYCDEFRELYAVLSCVERHFYNNRAYRGCLMNRILKYLWLS
jgi:hypothetical protein